jgi:hypothetical protein
MFVLRAEIVTISRSEPKMVKFPHVYTNIYKKFANFTILSLIYRFATKFCNFTNIIMAF